jgi:hypothetical protein
VRCTDARAWISAVPQRPPPRTVIVQSVSPALRFAERFSPHIARPEGAYSPPGRNRPELLGLGSGDMRA